MSRSSVATSAEPSNSSGPRPGHFDRAADPVGMVGRLGERIAAEAAVDQHAEARVALGHLVERAQRQRLNAGDPRADPRPSRATRSSNWLRWSTASTVSSSYTPRRASSPSGCAPAPRRRAAGTGRSSRARNAFSSAQSALPARSRGARRRWRRRHWQSSQQRLQRLVAQPAAQEARHEGVARAQHVEHLDREAAHDDAGVEARRESRRETRRSPSAPRLHTSSASVLRADGAQRGDRVGRCRRGCGSPPRCRRSGRTAAATCCSRSVTASCATKRFSPMSLPVRPHSTGR